MFFEDLPSKNIMVLQSKKRHKAPLLHTHTQRLHQKCSRTIKFEYDDTDTVENNYAQKSSLESHRQNPYFNLMNHGPW